MTYTCETCNYKTDRKTDINRHNQSSRHLEKNIIEHTQNIAHSSHSISTASTAKEIQFECDSCHLKFTRLSSLTRHKKVCMDNKVDKILTTNKISTLEKENEKLQKQVETYETMLKSLTSPQTINYYNFINANYPNTPALEGKNPMCHY